MVIPEKQAEDWNLLEFFVPITESFDKEDNLMIRGVAINETTTLNNVKYVAEELEKAAPSFRNVPILLDHKNEIKNIVGRTTENVVWNAVNKRIEFEGKIMDKQIKAMIKDGRIGSVSIGAKVTDLTEEDDGSMKAVGIRGLEISLVAVPGDQAANFAQAVTHSFKLKEMAKLKSSSIKQLNLKEDKIKMVETIKEEESVVEEPTVEPVEEPVEEPTVETPEVEAPAEEKAPTVQNINVKVDNDGISEIRKEINEMKELLITRKKLKEELEEDESAEDETKGEVSDEPEETTTEENVVLERSDSGKLALYRDYSKESPDTKLHRLVR